MPKLKEHIKHILGKTMRISRIDCSCLLEKDLAPWMMFCDFDDLVLGFSVPD